MAVKGKVVYRVIYKSAWAEWSIFSWAPDPSWNVALSDAPAVEGEVYRTFSYAEANDPEVRMAAFVMSR